MLAGFAAGALAACGATGARPSAVVSVAGQVTVSPGERSIHAWPRAQVSVSGNARMTIVPRSYLGLSTEYWALPRFARRMPLLERVLSLLHVRGDGPMILRIGGDSADHAFWDPHELHAPRWAFTLAPRWLARARTLVRHLGVRLILDLNLITDLPGTAARWARAAESGLPDGSIVALEVGNEPDIYSRANWLAITSGGPPLGRILPAALTARDYVRDFRSYAEALEQAAPHVMLAGPALASPTLHMRWVSALIAGARRSVGLVTVHRYPFSACAAPRSPAYPTVARLLGPRATTGLARSVEGAVRFAHAAGLALRLTELNSVTCGGRPGVSNSFATALWAPDALFDLLRAGVDGVNLHVRADAINAPFAITRAGLTARPLLYGLLFFARALGAAPRLVPVRLRAPAALHLQAWAVRVGPHTLHVVVIDTGRRSVRVTLRLPATGRATVQRLLAPSLASASGVTLGGRQLGPNGRWEGLPARETIAGAAGAYTLPLPRLSAALLSLQVTSGSLVDRRAPAIR
jgi:hypothetical protein